jgi:V/A-type H+-transporting ATPase subunit D
MALLAGRSQLALARLGRELLEQKRDALLREFYREVRIVFVAHEELEAAAGSARLALDEARVWLGPEQVAAAAAAARGEVAVEVESVSVMGVPVPAVAPRDLVRTAAARDRFQSASGPAVELVAQRFEEELTIAIRLATIEARVRRLAREIRRTSSRVNALRTRVIPGLEAEMRAIELALEQREREDRFRLKRIKRARGRADDRLAGRTSASRRVADRAVGRVADRAVGGNDPFGTGDRPGVG